MNIRQQRYFIFQQISSLKESFFKRFRGFIKLDSCSYYFETSNIIELFIPIKNEYDEVS